MLKFKFATKVIVIFVKNIKKDIEWYVHFICKSKKLNNEKFTNYSMEVEDFPLGT